MAARLTLALRQNRAPIRYRLWLAASVKLLIPFSLLLSVGSQFEVRTGRAVAPPPSSAIEQIGQPSAPPMPAVATPAATVVSSFLPALQPGEMGRGGLSESPTDANPPELTGPSIFAALQEQLGLRLEASRVTTERIVVDRAEGPSAN